ncbi:MAG TPA: extracellular solute-binding protein [Patescibacteria group bacterium]|nr:extracellular solute-binding protein [Patescibacteria group bacterium]
MANNDTIPPQSSAAPQQTPVPQAPLSQIQTSVPQPLPIQPSPAQSTPAQAPAGTPPTQNASSSSTRALPKLPKLPILKIVIGIVIFLVIIFLVTLFLPKGQEEKVTLNWWGLWEDPQIVEPIIAGYEKEHPNVDVVYSKQDPNQYRERVVVRSDQGNGPDIFLFHNTWYPMLSGLLVPLPTDVITQEAFQKTYYPVMQEDLIQNGAIYGIPFAADSLSLFVNTELLAAAGEPVPTTWEDFVGVARRLTVKEEDGTIRTAGAALGTYGNVTHAPDIISLLFLQQGIMMNQFGSSPQDEGDALDFYVSFAKGDQAIWNGDLPQSVVFFSQGKLAFYFGYSWDIFTIQRLNKDLQFTIHPVPSLFDRNTTVASYWVTGISNRSANQQEALAFLAYLAQKETVQKLYTEAAKTRPFGQLYPRVDLAESLKANTLIYPFVNQLKNARSSFFVSDTGDGSTGLNSVSNRYLENAVNGIITDGSSTQTVVETLNQGIAQVFAQYGIQ